MISKKFPAALMPGKMDMVNEFDEMMAFFVPEGTKHAFGTFSFHVQYSYASRFSYHLLQRNLSLTRKSSSCFAASGSALTLGPLG